MEEEEGTVKREVGRVGARLILLPFGPLERPPGLPLRWQAWWRRFCRWEDYRGGERPDLAWLLARRTLRWIRDYDA